MFILLLQVLRFRSKFKKRFDFFVNPFVAIYDVCIVDVVV